MSKNDPKAAGERRHELADLHRAIERVENERKALVREFDRIETTANNLQALAKANTQGQRIEWLRRFLPPRLQSKAPTKSGLLTASNLFLGVTSFLLSFVALYLTLAPRVSVSVSDSFNSKELFATSLSVSNDGPLPIYDVTLSCEADLVRFGRIGVIAGKGRLIGLPHADAILPSQRYTSQYDTKICPIGNTKGDIIKLAVPAWYADVGIHVNFRPKLWPFYIERSFYFRTEKAADGHFIWDQEPGA